LISTFLISLFTSLITIPIFGIIAKKLNIVDRPDNYLKPHEKATPYLGGLGIFIGMLPVFWKFSYIFIPISLLTTIGLTDDIFSLSPKLRLIVEFLSALLIVLTLHLHSIWIILYLFGIVALINAVNMIDGLDGICGGNVAISALFFLLLSQDTFSKQLSLALLGVSLGYLVYNFPPAKIFMGDAGSYLLGASLSVLYILTSRPIPSIKMISSFFPIWLYFLDLIAGIIRRIRNKKSPFKGDRDHIYDKLKRRVDNPKKVAVYTYLINASFSVLAFSPPLVGLTIAVILSLALIKFLNMFNYDK